MDATPVTVNGNSISGLTIITKPISRATKGYTGVIGRVTSNSGLGKITDALGVPGAIVSITDPVSGDVVSYGFTDSGGNYSVSDLTPGSYNVSVDYVGLSSTVTQSVTVSYDANGNPVFGASSFALTTVTAIENQSQTTGIPQSFTLSQNYPNPFNPTTTIEFSLPQSANVTLKVFNILGQEVATLLNGVQRAGKYTIRFDASRLASGVYLYRLQADNFVETKKLMLLK